MTQIALVSEESSITPSLLTRAAAAFDKQVKEHLSPAWALSSFSVAAFTSLADIPVGAWPVIIKDDIGDSQAEGLHQDDSGCPLGLVTFDDGWTLTASHEICEMCVDPTGNLLAKGASPSDDHLGVSFLIEVCDPCEDPKYSYQIDGITVSDFVTQAYFCPTAYLKTPGSYSFTGAVKNENTILNNGYISWVDVDNNWWQQTNFDGQLKIVSLGKLDNSRSARSQISERTGGYKRLGFTPKADLRDTSHVDVIKAKVSEILGRGKK